VSLCHEARPYFQSVARQLITTESRSALYGSADVARNATSGWGPRGEELKTPTAVSPHLVCRLFRRPPCEDPAMR
jgi:hypothetical protein